MDKLNKYIDEKDKKICLKKVLRFEQNIKIEDLNENEGSSYKNEKRMSGNLN